MLLQDTLTKNSCETDSGLVWMAQHGHAEGVVRLYERHFPRLLKYTRFQLRNDSLDPRDVCQDSFVIAIDRLSQFKLGYPFYPWLLGIARNRLRMHWRERKHFADNAGLQLPDIEDMSESIVDNIEIADTLRTISRPHRHALILRYFHGYSCREMAKELGISLSSMEKRLYRAKMSFRDAHLKRRWLRGRKDSQGAACLR